MEYFKYESLWVFWKLRRKTSGKLNGLQKIQIWSKLKSTYFWTIIPTWNLITGNNYSFSQFYHTAWMVMNKIGKTFYCYPSFKNPPIGKTGKPSSYKTDCKWHKKCESNCTDNNDGIWLYMGNQ